MRLRSTFLFALIAVVAVLSACSSTTVVASDNRAPTPAADEGTTSAEPSAEESPDDASGDPSSTEDVDAGGDEPAASDDDGESAEAETDEEPADTEAQTPRQLEEAEGFGLGGAEQLGALLNDCEAGSDMACDVLFQLSNFDSIEEEVALTCGGRASVETRFCTDGINALDDQLVFDPTSDGLDGIVSLCVDDGDMTACDFLYFRSPEDSEFEEVGGSCGGRVTVAVPDCRTFLADVG